MTLRAPYNETNCQSQYSLYRKDCIALNTFVRKQERESKPSSWEKENQEEGGGMKISIELRD